MQYSSNYKKHTSKNPVQQYLLRKYKKHVIRIIKPLHLSSIVDIGCGEGLIANTINRIFPDVKIVGVDISKDAIALAKKSFPTMELRQADIYSLPYKSNSFTMAMCLEVLEHLHNPDAALQEALRVSKKYCLLSVPDEPKFRIANLLRGKNISRLGNDIEHIQHWSTSSFMQFVRKYSTIVEITNSFPWTIVLVKKNE